MDPSLTRLNCTELRPSGCGRWAATRAFLFLFAISGCVDTLVSTGPPDTPASNFDVFWQEFDRLYAFFDLKEVEWDEARISYGERVKAVESDEELLSLLAELVYVLNDGHVFLMTPDTLIQSDEPRSDSTSFDLEVVSSYAIRSLEVVGDGKIHYGRMSGGVGYIYISGWTDKGGALSAVGAWAREFDIALDSLADVRGLIVDVRDNSGGSYFNGRFVAGRFARERVLATYSQFRNGPQHSDFTPLEAWYVLPRGRHVDVPVALLTNSRTASAAEWFVLAMRRMRNVIHVGTTTAGAMGTRIRRILPNGWVFGMPVQRLYSAELDLLEEEGIAPDVLVSIHQEDVLAARDPVLERALKLLR